MRTSSEGEKGGGLSKQEVTINIIHMPLERIDQLCKEEEKIVIYVNAYKTERYKDDDETICT